MHNLVDQARQIVEENRYMTIATAAPDGKPWISPVFFAYDSDYNLFWVSNKNSLHSKLIRQNPRAAIVIFDSKAGEGEGDAVYFDTLVHELEDLDEIRAAMKVLGKRVTKDEFRVKSVEEVTKAAAWRIYKAMPQVVSKLTTGEYINGQYVDKRVEISLN
ncbi:MAG: hypothetical protein C5B53_10875 [Candidatus Melainabacteria bacterium]|nr:MAG: hypothetical protein C5B53_10875 [Candidatus Melainabacteria bacterium]